jgi:nitric oxide reductase activation protein
LYFNKALKEQREINLEHFNANYIKYKNSILKLTNKIRNTMLAYFESYTGKSEAGRLNAPKIWRNVYLNDNRVFTKVYNNDIGNLSVDILLDASASQHERQETIAAEAYIIAESFTQCQIPVRVYSFSSLRNYTVINLYRDYDETDKNNKIFNYKTTGCNRDGLAIRTALYMMEGSNYLNKILIVLSDCKPNDTQCIPDTGIKQEQTKYAGATGIIDTAFEVKRGINNGNSILCVFTGEDEDIPTVKKIYGHNFARIYYPERFAEIVGVLMQNQLKNL